jgi:tRNA-dihydrouridine synthase A
MMQPQRVADCVAAMQGATSIPVTVKHRIGVDELDRYEDMAHFVQVVAAAGCQRFTVHARKAWLQGLSPKENRNVPPLRYEDVHRLKRDFPHLRIEINGGLRTLDQARSHLQGIDGAVDGVMIGRAAYDNPYLFAAADRHIYGEETVPPSRHEVAEAMLDYADHWVAQGFKLNTVTRHMLQLFFGQPGSRTWRRIITEKSCRPGNGSAVIREALAAVPRELVTTSQDLQGAVS